MKEKILAYARKKFGDIDNFLICGSFLTKEYSSYSDIDIVIITKEHNIAQNHTVLIDLFKIQYVIVPILELTKTFYDDYKSYRGSFCHMLANSTVAYNTKSSSFLVELQNHAKDLLKLKKNHSPDIDIYQLRFIVSNHLFDLKSTKCTKENIFSISELITQLSALKMIAEGKYIRGGGRHKYRALVETDKTFTEEMYNAVKNYYSNDSLHGIITFTEKYLNRLGGILTFYSKNKILTQVDNDLLLISVKRKSLSHFMKELIDFIKNNSLKNSYNLFLSEEYVYIEILSKKETINNLLLPKLEDFTSNCNIDINFPLRREFHFEFLNINNYIEYVAIYNEFETIIKRYRTNEERAIGFAFSILLLIENFFDTQTEYNNFLNNLIQYFLPYYYDDGYTSSTIALVKKKKKSLEIFNKKLIEQREVYYNILMNNLDFKFSTSLSNRIKNMSVNNNFFISSSFYGNSKYSYLIPMINRLFSMLYIEDSFKSFIVYIYHDLQIEKNEI